MCPRVGKIACMENKNVPWERGVALRFSTHSPLLFSLINNIRNLVVYGEAHGEVYGRVLNMFGIWYHVTLVFEVVGLYAMTACQIY